MLNKLYWRAIALAVVVGLFFLADSLQSPQGLEGSTRAAEPNTLSQYRVVQSTKSTLDLARQVEQLLAEGYVLVGGIHSSDDRRRYLQAMAKSR